MKNKKQLTREQRYTISRMLKAGCTRKEICIATGKDKSVISRELRRNGGKRGYSAAIAQETADMRKERMRVPRKLSPELRRDIISMIKDDLSPRQIEGRMRLEKRLSVSHETIYRIIRKDKAEGGSLYRHTRHRLKHRKRPAGENIPIRNRVSIDERPEIVNLKGRFGDWEFDTIVGKDNQGAILTMVERTTAFMMMEKLDHGKNAKELTKVAVRMLTAYMKNVRSITCDNGTEFADHENIAKALKTKFFFTHPYSSWEKGLIENTNKLIRQYIPKSSDFKNINNQYIRDIQYKLNDRPRANLKFYSPKEIFFLNLQGKSCID